MPSWIRIPNPDPLTRLNPDPIRIRNPGFFLTKDPRYQARSLWWGRLAEGGAETRACSRQSGPSCSQAQTQLVSLLDKTHCFGSGSRKIELASKNENIILRTGFSPVGLEILHAVNYRPKNQSRIRDPNFYVDSDLIKSRSKRLLC